MRWVILVHHEGDSQGTPVDEMATGYGPDAGNASGGRGRQTGIGEGETDNEWLEAPVPVGGFRNATSPARRTRQETSCRPGLSQRHRMYCLRRVERLPAKGAGDFGQRPGLPKISGIQSKASRLGPRNVGCAIDRFLRTIATNRTIEDRRCEDRRSG